MVNRGRSRWQPAAALALALALPLALVGVATGCGADSEPSPPSQPSTPEGTLQALAKAVSASDDAAVSALVCAEARGGGRSIADVKAQAKEADPKLADLRYEAQAGSIVEQTSTTAVGTLVITVHGVPDDLSDAGRQFLDSVEAPRPLNLQRRASQFNLINRDGGWLICT